MSRDKLLTELRKGCEAAVATPLDAALCALEDSVSGLAARVSELAVKLQPALSQVENPMKETAGTDLQGNSPLINSLSGSIHRLRVLERDILALQTRLEI